MVIHKKLLNIAAIAMMLVSCQQEADDFPELSCALGNASVENRTAERLFRLMERQDGAYKRLQQSLGTGTPDFAHTETGATADYGTFYLIPYTDAEGVVSGAIIYPTDEQNADLETRSLDGVLGTPVNVTPEYLNTDIPITSRLLYSNRFLVWSDNGLTVSPRLYQFALKLSEGDVMLTDEERIAFEENNPKPLTRYYRAPEFGYVHLTFETKDFDWIKVEMGATSVGLSRDALATIIRQSFESYKYQLNAEAIDLTMNPGGTADIVLKGINEAYYYPNNNMSALWPVMEEIRLRVFEKGFSMTIQYTYERPQKVVTPSTGSQSGGTGGGTYTGGTTGGLGSVVDDGPDLSRFVDDCVPLDSVRKKSIRTIIDNIVATNDGLLGDQLYARFSSFEEKALNAKIEYGTTLQELSSIDDNGLETMIYGLSPIVEGTEKNVEPELNRNTVVSIHNHPNGSVPSFMDVLSVANDASLSYLEKFIGSMVYCSKTSTRYILYVEDKKKASAFFEKIEHDIDTTTNDCKSHGVIQAILLRKNIDRAYTDLIYRLVACFALMDAGIALYSVDKDNTVTSYRARRTYRSNGKEKNSLIFYICK